MNSPPSSLASLLAYPPAQASTGSPAGNGVGVGGHVAPHPEDGDPAVLMSYLRDHYEGEGDAARPYLAPELRLSAPSTPTMSKRNSSGAGIGPSSTSGHALPPLPETEATPLSPIDHSVPIPASLQALPVPALDDKFALPPPNGGAAVGAVTDAAIALGATLDRGEMGGKRRKPPHERAGWRDMEENAERGSKRARNIGAAANAAAGGSESAPEQPISEGFVGFGSDGQVNDGGDGAHPASGGDIEDESKTKSRGKGNKESRAEQNRKAQQIFRRKREEKMKQLEMDAIEAAATRANLAQAVALNAELTLALEARIIENTALRHSLMTIGSRTSTSFVKPDGTLVISSEDYEYRDVYNVAANEIALDSLGQSSRQLAKLRAEQRRIAAASSSSH